MNRNYTIKITNKAKKKNESLIKKKRRQHIKKVKKKIKEKAKQGISYIRINPIEFGFSYHLEDICEFSVRYFRMKGFYVQKFYYSYSIGWYE